MAWPCALQPTLESEQCELMPVSEFLFFIFGKVMQGRMGQGHEWKLQISILVLLFKMPCLSF